MTKLKTYVTAIFMAIVLAIMCIIPAVPVFASNGDDSAPTPQFEAYDKLYYFSDSNNAQQRLEDYIQNYLYEYDSMFMYHHTETEFIDLSPYNQESLLNYFYSDFVRDYYDIENSFIIFELSKIGVNDAIASYLDYLFYDYKYNNNCKIMFISGTDEQWYSERRFLEWVDIHFDTDLFYDFMTNIMHRAGKSQGKDFDELTFIFDKSLNYGIMEYNNPKSHTILNTFIIKALLSLNHEDINNNNPPYLLRDVFTNYNVNLLFYIEEGKYYDAIKDVVYDMDYYEDNDELNYMLNSTHVIAIGTSWLGYDEVQSFIDNTQELFNIYGLSNVEFYIYNPDNYPVYSISEYHEYHTRALGLEEQLSNVIYDFIMGNDLTVYNNWTGRCDVTYKLITFGPDGWMIDYCDWWEGLDDIELNWETSYPYNKDEEKLKDFIDRILW